MKLLSRFLLDDRGATAIEYSLIAGFIGLVIVGSVSAVGSKLTPKFQSVANGLS